MQPTNQIYTSGPVAGSEAVALETLSEKLVQRGRPFLIFSNVNFKSRQVDFIVVTERRVAHLELKHFLGPIEAGESGPWYTLSGTGTPIARIPLESQNPTEQAKNAKYAISDCMEAFARRAGLPPLAKGEKYFHHFESAVCVYPRIHPDSLLTKGDFKVRVWSFNRCLDEMDASSIANPWPMDQWKRFAAEYLKLDCVSLAEAISEDVYRAGTHFEALSSKQVSAFNDVVRASVEVGPDLPLGQNLLVYGRHGIGKTLAATRLALKAVSAGYLCFLVKCMRYRGDFARLLRSSVPYAVSSVSELLEVTKARDGSVLLILDGLDQVTEAQRADLLEGSAALFEQCQCTVVIMSSERVSVPETIRGDTIVLEDLSADERRKIYFYYAPKGTPFLDLSAFPAAHDVKVAAQAAAGLSGNATPSAVYDTYFRLVLGKDIATTGVKVCRRIARHVFDRFNPFLSHEEFDTIAEEALTEFGAPVAFIDHIKNTRLFDSVPDGVSFAHDLLVRHLTAAEVANSRYPAENELVSILDQPLYRPLVGDVIGRLKQQKTARDLLFRYASQDLFQEAYLGHLGDPIKDEMSRFLEDVLQRCEEELSCLQLEVSSTGGDGSYADVRPRVAVEPTGADSCAIPLVLKNLETFLPRIVEIFGRYGECLLIETRRLADAGRVKQMGVLDLYLRREIVFSGPRLRCSHLVKIFTEHSFVRRLPPEIYSVFKRAFEAGRKFNPILDYVACSAWENCSDPDASEMLRLFRKCWDSKSSCMRVKALDMFEFQLHWLTEQDETIIDGVASELESRLGNNIFTNTSLFDILSRLGRLEAPVSEEQAGEEVRGLLEQLKSHSPDEKDEIGFTVAQRADGFVGKIFEEVFSAAYFPLYNGLAPVDKATLLNAASMDDEHSGNHDFYLKELVRLKQKSSKIVFEKYCRRTPGKSFMVGSEHKLFAGGIAGLAAIGEPLPDWVDENVSPSIAWKALREIVYLELVGRTQEADALWQEIESEDPLGGVVALLELWTYGTREYERQELQFAPEKTAPRRVKRLLEIGLKNWSRLNLGLLDGRPFGDAFSTACSVLGAIGDEATVKLLEPFTQDGAKGAVAIETIRTIKKLLRSPQLRE